MNKCEGLSGIFLAVSSRNYRILYFAQRETGAMGVALATNIVKKHSSLL